MDSRAGSRAFPLAVAVRTLLAAIFAFLMLQILATTHLYATGIALGGLAILTYWDTARLRSALPIAGVDSSQVQHVRIQQHELAMALLDAVTVALIALAPDGRISFANRAARLLAGAEVGRLADIPALEAGAADQILALPPGARQIITLSDGRLILVWVVGFSTPGQPGQKLVSLQAVAGELDAVQVRAWQDMTRVLSHEIMNSLTPIASLSESVANLMQGREDADPEVAHAVQAIARRSVHLIDFVERYRQVAELPEPRLHPIRATELIADIEALLQTGFVAQEIAYQSVIQPGDLTFAADPELLAQAILNLLRNAAEAVTAVERPAISLSCERIGSDFVCTVCDNGPGIPTDRQQEVFVPFFTTKPGGSGIGLTLVRQVALAHGGRIEAQNNPGGGARFTMTIPASNWETRDSASPAPSVDAVTASAAMADAAGRGPTGSRQG